MPVLDRIDRWRAGIVDAVSFGFVNALQRRHPLPPGFRERWEKYVADWSGRPVGEYYAIPQTYAWPDFPRAGSGPWRFPSPVASDFPGNNTAAFDLYPCPDGWRAPTMVLAHGLMSVSDIGYRIWAQRLNARGWNAVFMHLPYHYSRRLKGHVTGEFAVNAHLVRVAEGIRQASMEVRILLETLRRVHGTPLFGGWGTSYGGWVMGMTAAVEPLLQRVILVEPILNIESAVWESPAAVTLRSRLRRAGLGRECLRPHLRLCCPSKQKPQLAGRHILLIAGSYDRIAPPEDIHQLHLAWPGSHYYCFPQGHVGYTLMPSSFRMALELWAEDFAKPAKVADDDPAPAPA
jgi:hypothetical protein